MPAIDIAGATALVTGASRGFGRGIATSLSQAGAAITSLITDPGHDRDAYLLTAAGLSPAP